MTTNKRVPLNPEMFHSLTRHTVYFPSLERHTGLLSLPKYDAQISIIAFYSNIRYSERKEFEREWVVSKMSSDLLYTQNRKASWTLLRDLLERREKATIKSKSIL